MAPSVLVLALTLTALACLSGAHAQAPPNVTGILSRAGQFTVLIRLLQSTQVANQITNTLNNSNQGLTLFAPTDNAFNSLPPGTLNSLSQQDQVTLILYHVLPQFYSLQGFQTLSNPVRTQASGMGGGQYTLNVTTVASSMQVNVTTGLVTTPIANSINVTSPLAVYEVDKVLLPLDMFGVKPPTGAPQAAETPTAGAKTPVAAGPTAAGGGSNAASSVARGSLLGVVMAVVVWVVQP
ncbi:hypothetical protein AMTRI_Chr01g133460 [Amborella trichopoda]|uniref:FAS1 domain-containing protein n=1 Tax=Amborella trichopoda TaxID=13333 RepID=W1NEQ6_AMBTC|nr:fasciclin-like arabinogalactan protein 6 [Amborella trichopoda]ERM93888.1 hypothetical protein AMTR_s00393p00013250 [Amborella trichopoda]|eukprot:XP_006826651.1 fasciclin-like arabinogalactan protein 6 [Amborella trichopoda]